MALTAQQLREFVSGIEELVAENVRLQERIDELESGSALDIDILRREKERLVLVVRPFAAAFNALPDGRERALSESMPVAIHHLRDAFFALAELEPEAV